MRRIGYGDGFQAHSSDWPMNRVLYGDADVSADFYRIQRQSFAAADYLLAYTPFAEQQNPDIFSLFLYRPPNRNKRKREKRHSKRIAMIPTAQARPNRPAYT